MPDRQPSGRGLTGLDRTAPAMKRTTALQREKKKKSLRGEAMRGEVKGAQEEKRRNRKENKVQSRAECD